MHRHTIGRFPRCDWSICVTLFCDWSIWAPLRRVNCRCGLCMLAETRRRAGRLNVLCWPRASWLDILCLCWAGWPLALPSARRRVRNDDDVVCNVSSFAITSSPPAPGWEWRWAKRDCWERKVSWHEVTDNNDDSLPFTWHTTMLTTTPRLLLLLLLLLLLHYYYCSQKILPLWRVLKFIFQKLKYFKRYFMCIFCIQIYSELQSFIQLSLTMTRLCHSKWDHPQNFYISLQVPLYRVHHKVWIRHGSITFWPITIKLKLNNILAITIAANYCQPNYNYNMINHNYNYNYVYFIFVWLAN